MPVASTVSRLAHLPPPVLTVYLDTNPANARNQSTPRGYAIWFKSASRALAKELTDDSRKQLRREVRKVTRYLQDMATQSRALALFSGPHVWEEIRLEVPVIDELHWGKASLQQMAWVLDEHRSRGAVLIDGFGARFFRFWMGTVTEEEAFPFSVDVSFWRTPHLVGPSTPGVSKRHGIARDRIASRAEEQRTKYLKQLSGRIVAWSEEGQIGPIVLVGKADELEEISRNTPESFRKQLARIPKILPQVSPTEATKRLRPILDRWERQYELSVVSGLLSDHQSGRSVVGIDGTLDQLQQGNVSELVVSRGLEGTVQQCTNCGWVTASTHTECPVCGSKREARTLRTLVPELASSRSVPIEVVAGRAAENLRTGGGIGARLLTARAASRRKTNLPILSEPIRHAG